MNNTNENIRATQPARDYSGLIKLLTLSIFFIFPQFTEPITAGATVCAYMDAQGEIHYTPAKSSGPGGLARKCGKETKPRTLVGRSALPSKKDSNTQTINAFIQAAATEHGVDPLLIKAIIKAESNFDPTAVSPKGAQGLMQLMPATAKDLQVTDPFDPLDNITGGTRYLRSLLDSYDGNVVLSLAAYNAGPGRVKEAVPNIRETKFYVSKVIGNYQSYRNNR